MGLLNDTIVLLTTMRIINLDRKGRIMNYMRTLAIEFLHKKNNWACLGQEGMADLLIEFSNLVEEQKSTINHKNTYCFLCGNNLQVRYWCDTCNDASHPKKI